MNALRAPDATEVEAHGGEAGRDEGVAHRGDDNVVAVTAVQRMGVGDDGRAQGIGRYERVALEREIVGRGEEDGLLADRETVPSSAMPALSDGDKLPIKM